MFQNTSWVNILQKYSKYDKSLQQIMIYTKILSSNYIDLSSYFLKEICNSSYLEGK